MQHPRCMVHLMSDSDLNIICTALFHRLAMLLDPQCTQRTHIPGQYLEYMLTLGDSQHQYSADTCFSSLLIQAANAGHMLKHESTIDTVCCTLTFSRQDEAVIRWNQAIPFVSTAFSGDKAPRMTASLKVQWARHACYDVKQVVLSFEGTLHLSC